MKKLIMAFMAIMATALVQAQMYSSTTGDIYFFSEAPLENIEATNKDGRSLINTETSEVAVVVAIKGFHFEKALMEEHFNENYLESSKYPTAVFKGKINEDIDFSKDGTYEVSATGKLNIHGVEQERTLKGTLVIEKGKMTLDTKFPVALKDHNIKIPTAVVKNIAEVVEVTAHFIYEPKK